MRVGMYCLLLLLLMQSSALAQEASPCPIAMHKELELVRGGHYVDAHLLAQTMALICQSEAGEWELLDAIALTRLEEHERAHALLESLSLDPGPLAERSKVLAVWVLAEGGFASNAASTRLEPEDAARLQVFARIKKGQSPGPAAASLSQELQLAVSQGYRSMQSRQSKRPWLAGVLSAALPGLGQVYAGSWQSAGVSLVLNGLFIGATVELARHELYAAAATTGMAGSVFYVGNVLNAVDLAQRYNQSAALPGQESLERILVPEANP